MTLSLPFLVNIRLSYISNNYDFQQSTTTIRMSRILILRITRPNSHYRTAAIWR